MKIKKEFYLKKPEAIERLKREKPIPKNRFSHIMEEFENCWKKYFPNEEMPNEEEKVNLIYSSYFLDSYYIGFLMEYIQKKINNSQ